MASIIDEDIEVSEQEWDGRTKLGTSFLAGLLAGMVMTIVMLVLLLLGVTPRSVSNLVSDKIASVAGPGITEFFIQTIGALGKEMLFLSVLIGQAVAGGVLGLLMAFITRRTTNQKIIWRNAFIVSTGFWVAFVVAGLPLLDQGFLGANLGTDQFSILIISFMLFQLFGLVLGYAFISLLAKPVLKTATTTVLTEKQVTARQERLEVETRTSRRRFVGTISAVFVLVVGAAIGTRAFGGPALTDYRASLGDTNADGTWQGEVTPTANFYQVSKNTFNPNVDGKSWKLTIDGLVNNPQTFDMDSLSQLPRQKIYHTLTCISNPVGGDYIGNAEWSGIQFKKLLDMAGVKPGVRKVVFTSADGYKDSITIDKAMEDNTTLAIEMNGAPLTTDHGYPARMLIPNIYGMKNAKWLTNITLIDTDFAGFWQQQGWDNTATIQIESSFVAPQDGDTVPGGQTTTLKGVAYAGSRNITKIEVSTDSGTTWTTGTIKPRLGPNSWTLWRYDWTPPAGNKGYILQVRATTEGDVAQTFKTSEAFPSGSTGYHTISLRTV